MNIQMITPEEKDIIRKQRRKEALKRAQLNYYTRNKEYIIKRNSEYLRQHPELKAEQNGKEAYKKIKEDPEKLQKLKEYHKKRYQQKKATTSESGSDSGNNSDRSN